MKEGKTFYTVGEICALTDVTRKTLFYYDRRGLLKPVQRTGSQQHKLYDNDSLLKLRQIIRYRDAGLTIAEITILINDPKCDAEKILREALQRIIGLKEQKEAEIIRLRQLIEELQQ